MTHQMKLHDAPFSHIKSGQKTIELRLFDDKRRLLRAGDTICFTNSQTGERLCTEILHLHVFSSFDELYRTLPLLKCGYTDDNIADASPRDMDVYYAPTEQQEFGVVGIELRVVSV